MRSGFDWELCGLVSFGGCEGDVEPELCCCR